MLKRTVFPFIALVIFGPLVLARGARAADPTQPTTGRWTSFGNGPAHSGFYPATIGAATPVPGWTKSYSPTAINQVVISDGRVFVSSNGTNDYTYPYPQANPFILALDETTGAELWRVPGFYMTHMTVGDTHLYSAGFETNLLALRVADGTIEWMRDNYDYSGPPGVVGDRLSASATSGVAQFRISDNTPQIGGNLIFAGYDCRHSVSEGTFYIRDPRNFIATDTASGGRLWSIPISQDSQGSYDNDIPAVAEGRAAFAGDASRRVITVDLKTKKVLWSILGTYPNYYFYPVANDGSAVYVVVNRGIDAYAAATGELLGRYDFARGTQSDPKNNPLPDSQPIVTNDAVIVATAATTFIFDKATFQLRTELPTGGYLSYTRGVLYVAESGGKLSTFHFPDATEPPP
ncbi:MAG: large repetitive protein, partial [Verrucomicrobiota bacterium]